MGAAHTFKLLDTDHSGTLDREEFIVGCLRLKGGTTAVDSEMTMRTLKNIQKNLKALKEKDTKDNALAMQSIQSDLEAIRSDIKVLKNLMHPSSPTYVL